MKYLIKSIIALSLLTVVLTGCGSNGENKNEVQTEKKFEIVTLSKESIKQIRLEIETARLQPITGFITVPAKVITDQDNEAQIGSLVQGRVKEVFVKAGDHVKAGQVLMTVEGLDVGEIKAGYLKSKANLDFAKADFERHKILYEQNVGSKQSYLEAKAEFEKTEAEFNAEDKKIHSIGLNDDDILGEKTDSHTAGTLPIKSSINGVVVERNVVIGQLVDATTNAFKVINTNTVWIDGQLYEKDITKLNQKTSAEFTAPAFQNEKFNGKIIYIGQTVEEQTRTITIRGEFSNAANKLKPQMFGELKIPLGSGAKGILVNEEAIVRDAGETYLFVQLSDSTFQKRNVIAGIGSGGMVEIKEGLKEGDKVVSKGSFFLKSELKKEELSGD